VHVGTYSPALASLPIGLLWITEQAPPDSAPVAQWRSHAGGGSHLLHQSPTMFAERERHHVGESLPLKIVSFQKRVRLNSTQISVYPGAPFNSTHLKLANSTKDLPWVGNRGTSRRDTFQVVPSRLLRVAAALPFLDTYPLRIMELFKRQQVP
jgi:hypothetical protein